MFIETKTIPTGFEYQPQSLADKNILVTGGTTGIGRATAMLLASQGANVLIFGRHEQELNDALNDLRHVSQAVSGFTADVSRSEDIRRVFIQVNDRFGRGLDVLINNAALGAQDVASTDFEQMEYIIRTNLLGYMACTHEALQRMQANRSGHIVNIGSMSADVREKDSSIYVATKAGIHGFSESLRKEVNQYGIKVSLIEPGMVGTNMQEGPAERQQQQEQEMKMLKAEDIALAVYFCLIQPPRSDIVNLQIRPHLQSI